MLPSKGTILILLTSLYPIYYIISSPVLGVVRGVDFCKSDEYEMIPHCDVNCSSLITNKVESIFICVLTFCGFSAQSLPLKKKIAYLRDNSQTLKVTLLKGTIQWFLCICKVVH